MVTIEMSIIHQRDRQLRDEQPLILRYTAINFIHITAFFSNFNDVHWIFHYILCCTCPCMVYLLNLYIYIYIYTHIYTRARVYICVYMCVCKCKKAGRQCTAYRNKYTTRQ